VFRRMGSLEVRPLGGVAWAQKGRPVRMRATHHRPHGIEHFLSFYDVVGTALDEARSVWMRSRTSTQDRRCWRA
jgi:hypothetical protein